MIHRGPVSRFRSTGYIKIDTRRCNACWKCVEVCSQKALGKVDFFFHRHAVVDNPAACKGCLKCLKVCDRQAISVSGENFGRK